LFTLYPAVPAPFLPTTGHAQGRHWGRHGQRILAGGKNHEEEKIFSPEVMVAVKLCASVQKK
jgi:hypothetical protein